MHSSTLALLIFGGTVATIAVAWVLAAPVILFALHVESRRREGRRDVSEGISLDELDGVTGGAL